MKKSSPLLNQPIEWKMTTESTSFENESGAHDHEPIEPMNLQKPPIKNEVIFRKMVIMYLCQSQYCQES